MLHDDLYRYLTDTDAIAGVFDDRIFHEYVPQSIDEWPCLVFQLVATNELAEDMEEPFAGQVSQRMDQANYQFDVYGRKSVEVVSAGQRFDSVFRNFTGTMGTTRIQRVALGNISHLGEIRGDKQTRRVSLDYSIYYDA